MPRKLSFMNAARRLLEFPEGDSEENLRAFFDEACTLINRVDCTGSPPETTPGWAEWCEFRADIVVGWQIYWDEEWEGKDPHRYFPQPRENYRPKRSDVQPLLQEVVGLLPRRGDERWLASTEERCQWLVGRAEPKTREEFDEVLRGLRESTGRHSEGYKAIYEKLLADFETSRGVL